MKERDRKEAICTGQTALGIEFGSTRIKAVLIDQNHNCLAQGTFGWENCLENGLWTYHLEDVISGLQQCFANLKRDVQEKYEEELTVIGAIGISGMMHGYLPLDSNGRQLAPFLTWRNTNTAASASALTELFQFNIPLRWSIAQLYQAILNQERHVEQIDYLTTLAGYVHYLLSGKRVVGIGEASGIFPIDSVNMDYDANMVRQFDHLTEPYGFTWKVRDILPKVLPAGMDAGVLTQEGALLLDPEGHLHAGIPMVPPEGDAGTGMVATNSVAVGTGNVSAGTSIFSMVVLEKPLSRLYKDIDMVTTPTGHPVAMVHCNNGTSELDAWMQVFRQVLTVSGAEYPQDELYPRLFRESLHGALDCDGLLLYNYVSGEPVTGFMDGQPLLVRKQDTSFTLANLMRSHIYSVLASLSIGMQILSDENVSIYRLTGHGGLFRTPGVAQVYLAAAMKSPVTVMVTAGEGGPYGMAVLAAYRLWGKKRSLDDYLENCVYADAECVTVTPEESQIEGFSAYLKQYKACLPVEKSAVRCCK